MSFALFVVGQPLVLLIGVVLGKRAKDKGATEGVLVTTFDVLSEDFRPETYWMHPLLSLQKITVAGVLVFFEPSVTQVFAAVVLAAGWCSWISKLDPYPTTGENTCAFVLNLASFLIMLGALATKLNEDGEMTGTVAHRFTDALLWSSVIAAMAVPVLTLVNEWTFGNWQAKKAADSEPLDEDKPDDLPRETAGGVELTDPQTEDKDEEKKEDDQKEDDAVAIDVAAAEHERTPPAPGKSEEKGGDLYALFCV